MENYKPENRAHYKTGYQSLEEFHFRPTPFCGAGECRPIGQLTPYRQRSPHATVHYLLRDSLGVSSLLFDVWLLALSNIRRRWRANRISFR